MIVINLIANIILTASGMIFFLLLYGRESSIVHKWNFVSHWSLKIGLAAFVAGSYLNTLKFNNAPPSQVLMNVGLACIFSWAVIFHYKIFSNYGEKN
jgi:hypothetical protein